MVTVVKTYVTLTKIRRQTSKIYEREEINGRRRRTELVTIIASCVGEEKKKEYFSTRFKASYV